MTQIDEEINDLLSKVGSANAILMKYINDKVSELDTDAKLYRKKSFLLLVRIQKNKWDK